MGSTKMAEFSTMSLATRFIEQKVNICRLQENKREIMETRLEIRRGCC